MPSMGRVIFKKCMNIRFLPSARRPRMAYYAFSSDALARIFTSLRRKAFHFARFNMLLLIRSFISMTLFGQARRFESQFHALDARYH